DLAACDRKKRQLQLSEQCSDILVASHCALIDLEGGGYAVDPGFEVDEVDRVVRGQGDVIRLREVDVGQREGHSQRDRFSGGVDELIMHRDAVDGYSQVLTLHGNIVATHELQSAD